MTVNARILLRAAAIVAAMGLFLTADATADTAKFRDPSHDGQPGCSSGRSSRALAASLGSSFVPPCADAVHDITVVVQGHAKGGLLKHTVRFRGKARAKPILNIETKGGSRCAVTALTPTLEPEVRCYEGDAPGGAAKIVKKGKHKFRYTFSPEAIGDPSWYRWSFSFQGSGTAFDQTRKFKHVL